VGEASSQHPPLPSRSTSTGAHDQSGANVSILSCDAPPFIYLSARCI
jgi:hypothetical protein